MDLHFDGGCRVSLSQRNLYDLLAQVERYGEAELHRMTEEGWLVIIVQTDTAHYQGREPGAGSGLVS